jgi:TetR/AcrR family transcriptional regulator, transcriptional repressor for nem operon
MTEIIYRPLGGWPMGRASRAQAQEHREEVLSAAARLFRERGAAGVSVADLMSSVGLTHGGFYRQFASKEALLGEATGRAFADVAGLLEQFDAQNPDDRPAARRALVEWYLSAEHRDDAGHGCPSAGLGVDIGRQPADSPARAPFAEGVRAFAAWLAGAEDGDDPTAGLADLATLVGAMVLARATAGTPLSDEILAASAASLADS